MDCGPGNTVRVSGFGSSYLMKQEWSSTSITDRPTVDNLSSYFSQAQFLRNLDVRTALPSDTGRPPISDESYNEFVMQLAAYDTRRDFWLQSPYYKQRLKMMRARMLFCSMI